MAKTFTKEPLGDNWRHRVKTERGDYVMGKSWIDTAVPSDMMDYDFTDTFDGAKEAHAETRRMWAAVQVMGVR